MSTRRKQAVITHHMLGGFCITCGETEEWLAATNGVMVEPHDQVSS